MVTAEAAALFAALALAAALTACAGTPVAQGGAPAPEETYAPPEAPAEPGTDGGRNDAYFDSAVFIGDSVMEGLRQYVASRRKTEKTLGEARFLSTTIGVSLADLTGDRNRGVSYCYKGEEKPVVDIVAEMGASRAFLMLSLNDLSEPEPVIPDIIDRYNRLTDTLQAAIPGVEIVIMTNAPKTSGAWLPDYTENRDFGNALIDSFVAEVAAMCGSKGLECIDINAVLKDEDGALPKEYSRDGFVHINDEGSKAVVDALYAFADGKQR
jgi:lysophospholipase L1-like esterase